MGKRLLGVAFCGSSLWLRPVFSWAGKISSDRWSLGSVYTLVILPGCVLAKSQMALDEFSASGAPVSGNRAFFSGNRSLPPICSSRTAQAAPSRFSQFPMSTRHSKTKLNFARPLSRSNCPAGDGAIDARDGSAIRYSSCLCHRYGPGLLQFLA